MRRREFINLLGAVATLYPSCSRAEQPQKAYVIGFLALAEIPYLAKAWKDGMRKLGYIEGHNLRVEYRSLREGVSADALAAEVVKLDPDVIVTVGTVQINIDGCEAPQRAGLLFNCQTIRPCSQDVAHKQQPRRIRRR